MDAKFWHDRWEANQIGFHQGEVNRMLAAHHDRFPQGGRVFVPLCGKTRDIAWLRERGYRVAGAELSEIAVAQLFDEMGVAPQITGTGALKRYSGEGVDIFAGDIFELGADVLGPIDAVFDRAALIALPEEMRPRYAAHLAAITGRAPQILVTLVYDQAVMNGPPFSVTDAEVARHYEGALEITPLADEEVPGGIKGVCPGREKAWLLSPV